MININFSLTYLEIYLIIINIFTILIYSIDKLRAVLKSSHNRIPEVTLLLSVLIGGTIGAVISMLSFRHKIKKLSFLLKFIAVIILQSGLWYYYFKIY